MSAISRIPRVAWSDCLNQPEPLEFVLPGLLVGSAGLLVGQGAIGKTMLALEVARAVAMGDAVAGGLYAAHEIDPGAVGLILGEDPPEVIKHRLHAMAKAHGMGEEDAAFLDQVCDVRSGVGMDMSLVAQARGGEVVPGPFVNILSEFCESKKLVMLDPLLLLAGGLNEQDNTVMGAVMRVLTRIAHETACAILVLHHVAKGGASDGREEQDRSRGASSITTSIRLQLDMRKPTASEMMDCGIPDGERDFYVRVAQVKANYSAPRDVCWLRREPSGLLRAVHLEKVPHETKDPRGARKGGGNASPF
jgi:RecA-family ATPase